MLVDVAAEPLVPHGADGYGASGRDPGAVFGRHSVAVEVPRRALLGEWKYVEARLSRTLEMVAFVEPFGPLISVRTHQAASNSLSQGQGCVDSEPDELGANPSAAESPADIEAAEKECRVPRRPGPSPLQPGGTRVLVRQSRSSKRKVAGQRIVVHGNVQAAEPFAQPADVHVRSAQPLPISAY